MLRTRTAQAIANELGTDIQTIYRWRIFYDEQREDLRLSELQDEVEAYQKKVA
ncbi:MAG: hypothetical protein H7336_09895 [Bacteriovorax sp.]|nr:hypothetical protein [Bacteriovorax sp.]